MPNPILTLGAVAAGGMAINSMRKSPEQKRKELEESAAYDGKNPIKQREAQNSQMKLEIMKKKEEKKKAKKMKRKSISGGVNR